MLQGERLAAMVAYVYEHAPFWRRKLDAAGVAPGDITGTGDIRQLPTCTKAELQADQVAAPPFGTYACTPPAEWVKFFTTSGTTGQPLRRVLSARDWRQVLDRFARRPPYRPEDVILMTTPVDALMGTTATVDFAAEVGALVVEAGVKPGRQKVELIAELEPTVVTGAPSYLIHLTELAAELGIDLSDHQQTRLVISIGEPGAAVPSTNRLLAERFGAKAVVDGYGLTEVFPLGSNCPFSPDIHLPEDLVYVECLRPDGDEPVAPGELGELTFTNLVGDTQPLLRFRSGDLGVLSDGTPCGCGCGHVRIVDSVRGRADDMIWYRGANVFPSAVEAVVRDVPGLGTEYRIVLPDSATQSALRLQVEADTASYDREALARVTAEALRGAFRKSVDIEVLSPGTLPRGDGTVKLPRVIDAVAARSAADVSMPRS